MKIKATSVDGACRIRLEMDEGFPIGKDFELILLDIADILVNYLAASRMEYGRHETHNLIAALLAQFEGLPIFKTLEEREAFLRGTLATRMLN